jgi:hypothetical protein
LHPATTITTLNASTLAHPTKVIIAASNSSSQWKSNATVICAGNADQNILNAYLRTGNAVELAPGTYNCDSTILPEGNTRLYGQGNTSIINLQSAYICITDVSNIEIDHLEITGVGAWTAIFIYAKNTDMSNFKIHEIYCNASGADDFEILTAGWTVNDTLFSSCDAHNPDGNGFSVYGTGNGSNLITNTTFYKCTVENAGVASSRISNWAVGFDTGENTDALYPNCLVVSNMYLINCRVNGAWESDFHIEAYPTRENIVFTGCDAQNAGMNPSYIYGWGFNIQDEDIVEYNNTASNNAGGDLNLDDTIYTPIIDGISPDNSSKTATSVNQCNCSGVIINTDSTHKELVLYSNDGNAVRQKINLGNYYAADDGNTYSFDGTQIIVQFTDYAIIRLVKTIR